MIILLTKAKYIILTLVIKNTTKRYLFMTQFHLLKPNNQYTKIKVRKKNQSANILHENHII